MNWVPKEYMRNIRGFYKQNACREILLYTASYKPPVTDKLTLQWSGSAEYGFNTMLNVNEELVNEIINWCKLNFTGDFYFEDLHNSIWIETEKDFAWFRLRWE